MIFPAFTSLSRFLLNSLQEPNSNSEDRGTSFSMNKTDSKKALVGWLVLTIYNFHVRIELTVQVLLIAGFMNPGYPTSQHRKKPCYLPSLKRKKHVLMYTHQKTKKIFCSWRLIVEQCSKFQHIFFAGEFLWMHKRPGRQKTRNSYNSPCWQVKQLIATGLHRSWSWYPLPSFP
jgi:hypothetical protein